ncbi:MAG: hydantoinase/oxoprolinase family protein [Candidatus Thorarchaeota archaeon]
MNILGLDIGGANTKAALLHFHEKSISKSFSYIKYFPFWEKTIKEIPKLLQRIVEEIVEKNGYILKNIDLIAITITAELSDAFPTKREGILLILDALGKVFNKSKLKFITNECEFINFDQAQTEYMSIAAANWVSTALYLGNFLSNCILIDAGSTTIDIIPIYNSMPVPMGRDDTSRLLNHELIYTGGLRTTIPSITHHVPYKGENIRISFEKFALISDVYRILNFISEDEYINDTADNRSKSLDDCYSRLSRIICKDIESISKENLDIIANFIYEKHLDIISREIQAFMTNLIKRYNEFKKDPKFVITGVSAEFLVKTPLNKLGYQNILSYEDITNIPNQISSSAFAVAGALNLNVK